MQVILGIDATQRPFTGTGRHTLEVAKHFRKSPAIEPLKFSHWVDGKLGKSSWRASNR
jgi:hypothetical protein